MEVLPRLRPLGTKWLLWLSFGALTAILVTIGCIGLLRLHSIATNFEKDHNIAKPRASVGHELEINIIGYSLSVWRYLSGIDGARQRAIKGAADLALQIDAYTVLAETARQRELASRLRTGWQEVHALGEALMATPAANRDKADHFSAQVTNLERFLDTELQPDAEYIFNAISAETHGTLQQTEIVTLSLLVFGLVIALVTGRAVGRAVLAGEVQLQVSEEQLTSLNATLEQKAVERAHELRELNADLDHRVVLRTRALGDSQKKLRALLEQLTRAEEQERHRLATELHDYLGQLLAVSQISLGRAEKFAVSDDAKSAFTDARQSLNDSIAYTRTLIAQLSPQVLYDLGLPAALAWLGEQMEQQHELRVEVVGIPTGFTLDEARAILAFQCARELLWNVVKHGATKKAEVSYELNKGALTLEVTDRGRGFDLANVESQAGGSEKFGLFGMRQRLELHQGRLVVESAPGQGTSVKVILPAATMPTTPAASSEPAFEEFTVTAKPPLRIALVDDHEIVRQGLRWLLEVHEDIRVVGEAKDGPGAIAMAKKLKPDVIVMDVNMPGLNGIEATRRIVLEQPGMIVIGLSFASDSSVQGAMKDAGAYACLNKERAAEDIYQAIVEAIDQRPTDTT